MYAYTQMYKKRQTLLYQCQHYLNIIGVYGFLYYTKIQASYYVII